MKRKTLTYISLPCLLQSIHDDASTIASTSDMTFDINSVSTSHPHATRPVPADNEQTRELLCHVYQNYNFKTKYDENLPILKYREEVGL